MTQNDMFDIMNNELDALCSDYTNGKPDAEDVKRHAEKVAAKYGATVTLDEDQNATWIFDMNPTHPADLSVTDEQTAKDFLTSLFVHGLAYHPDDSAADCLHDAGLSGEQLSAIQANVTATFDYVDPSAVLLDLINA